MMNRSADTRPPAIVMGGRANAISVVRSLASLGIDVHALNAAHEAVRFSRVCKWIRIDETVPPPKAWIKYLLGPESDHLRGAVLLACDDVGIELIVEHHQALNARFILEKGDPAVRRALLDKFSTYEIARRAGLATAGYWFAETRPQLDALLAKLPFPIILKPLFSPSFSVFGCKYLRADDQEQLIAAFQKVHERGIPFVLMEFIPGPDNLLCSYYTYIDADGSPAFHYTKTLVRRNPPNMGAASYHVTRHIPQAAELGAAFFRAAGLRGLGNIEFKLDPRDGRLKVMECNARFTASNELLRRSGLDLAAVCYERLTGQIHPVPQEFREGMTMLFPYEDYAAFRHLRRSGELSLRAWLADLCRTDCLPYFSWSDPVPSLYVAFSRIKGYRKRRLAREISPSPMGDTA